MNTVISYMMPHQNKRCFSEIILLHVVSQDVSVSRFPKRRLRKYVPDRSENHRKLAENTRHVDLTTGSNPTIDTNP